MQQITTSVRMDGISVHMYALSVHMYALSVRMYTTNVHRYDYSLTRDVARGGSMLWLPPWLGYNRGFLFII